MVQVPQRAQPLMANRPGDRARLWFDPANLHLFDPGTGERLTGHRLNGHVPEHQDPAGH